MNALRHFLNAALLALTALTASAEIIGVDHFDYPENAALNTQTGGTFWDYHNVAPTGHTGTKSNWDYIGFGGQAAVIGGQLVTTNHGWVKREYNGANESDGAINDANVAKAVYARVTVTTGATLPSYFGIASYDFATERFFLGKRTGGNTFGYEIIGGASASSAIAAPVNSTFTLVMRLDFAADRIQLFLNPNLSLPITSTANVAARVADAAYTATNWSTALRLASGDGGGSISWDNFVVATTWEDLTTVVTTSADEDNGFLGGGSGVSLREAVKYSPIGLITLASGLSGQTLTLTHSAGDMFIDRAVTIDATGLPSGFTLNGNNNSRHFEVQAGKSLTLHGLTLTGGNAGADVGGSILNYGTLTLHRCTLSDNTDNESGAIHQEGNLALATLSHCTITGNGSAGSFTAGGIAVLDGTLNLQHCTISRNFGNGGGGGGLFVQSPAVVNVANCIIAGNADSGGFRRDIANFGATLTATSTNLIGDNTSVETIFPASAFAGTADRPVNPKLHPLGSYGGPTPTMPPMAGSAAIDAAGAGSTFTTDQRGFARIVDGNASGTAEVDLGAVEAAFRFVTSNLDTINPGSLRRVIDQARLAPGWDSISFAPSLSHQTLNLGRSTSYSIGATDADSAIVVTDPDGLVIDASNLVRAPIITKPAAGNYRLFLVNGGGHLTLHNLTLTGGNPDGAGGGAIANRGGILRIYDSTLSGNSAPTAGGGAISSFNDARTITSRVTEVHRCTISANTALGGAAIDNALGNVRVFSCTISRNTSTNSGGAIVSSDLFTGTEIGSSIVSGNIANGVFGDLAITAGTNTFTSRGNNLIGAGTGISKFNVTGDRTNMTNARLAALDFYGGPTRTMALLAGSPALDAAGPVNETQQVIVTLDNFSLTFKGQTTPAFNSGTLPTANALAAALSALSTIGSGNVQVTKVSEPLSSTYTVTFIGSLSGADQPQLTSGGPSHPSITTLFHGAAAPSHIADQRGFSITGIHDIGAYEATNVVTTTADAGPGSLRQILASAGASGLDLDIITFAPGLTGPILLDSEIVVNDASGVTIDATDRPTGITIDAGPGTNRHFRNIDFSRLSLQRLKLTGGGGTGAETTNVGSGGAIHNRGQLNLSECTLSGNTAINAGAIDNRDPGILTIERSTLSGNTVTGGGGAIEHFSPRLLSISASTIANNSARFQAGGINSVFTSPVVLSHCTITGNAVTTSPSNGFGGVRDVPAGFVTVNNCIISGNTDPNPSGTNDIQPGFLADSFLSVNFIGGDANLAPLGDYGGPTQTMALRPGSPARNAGGFQSFPDQRSFPLVDGPDIGAYEAGNSLATNYNAFIWETLPNTATPEQTAPTFDFDGDGQTNQQEWQAGTDPASPPVSDFRATITRSGGNLIISFPTTTGSTYTLQRSDTLTPAGSWTSSGLPAALSGTGAERTFTVPVPSGVPRRYYRVLRSAGM